MKQAFNKSILQIIFFMFFLSGFCGLLYQIIWIRMAYAFFGVITPVLSVVISVFMLGLSIGSWLGGKYISKFSNRLKINPVYLYGFLEFLIGIAALFIHREYQIGEQLLLPLGEMNSFSFLLFSALILAFTILPACILMGMTFPFMMEFLKKYDPSSEKSFSFLYFANVLGALSGTLLTAWVLIELYGFQHTVYVGMIFNFTIGLLAFLLGKHSLSPVPLNTPENLPEKDKSLIFLNSQHKTFWTGILLFSTGFISMSMEVIWTRAFTPVIQTTTYAFASILAVYLLSTWIGSFLYRTFIKKQYLISVEKSVALLSLTSFFPIIMNDPRLAFGKLAILLSIAPLCGILGFITPALIDSYSGGSPEKAGRVYALNIVGCILGPLFASYLFLPYLGTTRSLIMLSAFFIVFFLLLIKKEAFSHLWSLLALGIFALLIPGSAFMTQSYDEHYAKTPGYHVKRDYSANIVYGETGMNKQLYVNGIGITCLTPITKLMAHIPCLYYPGQPQKALVICLGMGTTYRSLLSWNMEVTAVELVPAVKEALPFFFKDIVPHPQGTVVVDDGRRFLKRTREQYDVICIDPPPPLEAAGSSLLYSEEFLEEVKQHLSPNGILQHWCPGGEKKIINAIARSISNIFPYVHSFISIEDWGAHFIASMNPLSSKQLKELANKMPETARKDLKEWYDPSISIEKILSTQSAKKFNIEKLLLNDQSVYISDDRPYNEYFFLRRLFNES